MSYKGLPDDLLRKVQPLELQTYARGTGWDRIDGISGEIAVYRKLFGGQIEELIVPQNPQFSDFLRRIAEAIDVVSKVEARSGTEILHDLLIPPSDVLRFRIASHLTDAGTVPLNDGLSFMAGSRKALLATACSVVQPQAFHPRLSRNEAEEFISNCRLGQTERGSFVATFVCPINALGVESNDQGLLFPLAPAETFTRKVTGTLMKSVSAIVAAIDADNIARVVTPAPGELQISSNLCEALLEMQPTGAESVLQISSSWARTVPLTTDVPPTVRIRKDYFPIIEQIERELRPRPEPTEGKFFGRVAKMFGAEKDGRMQGDVEFLFLWDNEQLVRARLDLSPDDYEVACEAHKRNLMASVTGILFQAPRLNRIRDYREFELFKP
jgi:hypothetical protein